MELEVECLGVHAFGEGDRCRGDCSATRASGSSGDRPAVTRLGLTARGLTRCNHYDIIIISITVRTLWSLRRRRMRRRG